LKYRAAHAGSSPSDLIDTRIAELQVCRDPLQSRYHTWGA
jgi:hypothetical protein